MLRVILKSNQVTNLNSSAVEPSDSDSRFKLFELNERNIGDSSYLHRISWLIASPGVRRAFYEFLVEQEIPRG